VRIQEFRGEPHRWAFHEQNTPLAGPRPGVLLGSRSVLDNEIIIATTAVYQWRVQQPAHQNLWLPIYTNIREERSWVGHKPFRGCLMRNTSMESLYLLFFYFIRIKGTVKETSPIDVMFDMKITSMPEIQSQYPTDYCILRRSNRERNKYLTL